MTRRPLFPVAFAWVIGTAAGGLLPSFPIAGAVLLSLALLTATLAFGGHRATLLAALAAAAFTRASVTARHGEDTVSSFVSRRPVVVTGTIATDPDPSVDSCRFGMRAEEVLRWGQVRPAYGLVEVRATWKSAECLAQQIEYGDRVRVRGWLRLPSETRNPGEFSYRRYLSSQGVLCTLRADSPSDVLLVDRSAGRSPKRGVLALKSSMEAVLSKHLSPFDASIAEGLLFSRRSALAPSIQEAFVATGAVHLLSASGAHVAAIAWLLTALTGPLGRRARKPVALVLILILIAYGIMAGGRAAVARAVLTACIYWGADLVGRERDLPNTVCLSCLALLLVHPLDLFDLSFQLSFAAILGITIVHPPLSAVLKRKTAGLATPLGQALRAVLGALSISLAAQAGIWPVVAAYYGQISTVSPLANLAAVPTAGAAVVGSMVLALAGLAWQWAAVAMAPLVHLAISTLVACVNAFASIPGALIPCGVPAPEIILAWYALVLAVTRPWAPSCRV
ncbi:MAG: ComEC/Rec2 family competence protein [Armatimonadota bacterium]